MVSNRGLQMIIVTVKSKDNIMEYEFINSVGLDDALLVAKHRFKSTFKDEKIIDSIARWI